MPALSTALRTPHSLPAVRRVCCRRASTSSRVSTVARRAIPARCKREVEGGGRSDDIVDEVLVDACHPVPVQACAHGSSTHLDQASGAAHRARRAAGERDAAGGGRRTCAWARHGGVRGCCRAILAASRRACSSCAAVAASRRCRASAAVMPLPAPSASASASSSSASASSSSSGAAPVILPGRALLLPRRCVEMVDVRAHRRCVRRSVPP